MKTPKTTNTNELLAELLAPIIAHCQANRGAAEKLAKIYNDGISNPVHPSNMRRWLVADPTKRKTPDVPSFLRLLESWRTFRGADVVNNPLCGAIFCAVHGHKANHSGRECKTCGIGL